MRLRDIIAASTLALLPLLAHADSFTYNVTQNFAAFDVSGSITTDTNSGILTSSDITGYNLTLFDGSQTLNLTPANSQEMVGDLGGGSVTATPTGLFFNFDNTIGDILIFQGPVLGSGTDYLCFQGVAGSCDDFTGSHESIAIGIGGDPQKIQTMSGNVEFASTASTATPEPESLVLIGTGMLGLVGVIRRKLHA